MEASDIVASRVIDYPHLGKRYLLLHEGARGVSFYELGETTHPFGSAEPPNPQGNR